MNDQDSQSVNLKPHSAQLTEVKVAGLFIQAHQEPSLEVEIPVKEISFDANLNFFTRDNEPPLAIASMFCFAGISDINETSISFTDTLPFSFLAEVRGYISLLDPEKLPPDKFESWAKVNAPILMFPFLRAEVHALTLRAGFKPLFLPLVHLPLYRFDLRDDKTEDN